MAGIGCRGEVGDAIGERRDQTDDLVFFLFLILILLLAIAD